MSTWALIPFAMLCVSNLLLALRLHQVEMSVKRLRNEANETEHRLTKMDMVMDARMVVLHNQAVADAAQLTELREAILQTPVADDAFKRNLLELQARLR